MSVKVVRVNMADRSDSTIVVDTPSSIPAEDFNLALQDAMQAAADVLKSRYWKSDKITFKAKDGMIKAYVKKDVPAVDAGDSDSCPCGCEDD